jgi:hypothetical protein
MIRNIWEKAAIKLLTEAGWKDAHTLSPDSLHFVLGFIQLNGYIPTRKSLDDYLKNNCKK